MSYMLANGQGKQRAGRDGAARAVLTWRLPFLSSGEVTLADKMAEDRGRRAKAGQLVRVLDIPATGQRYGAFDDLHGHTDGQAFANYMKAEVAKNFGHPGPAFVERIIADPEGADEAARAFMNTIRKRGATDDMGGQVGRALDRFAIVGAAGELARAFGIVPWGEGEAIDAALTGFRLWLSRRGSSEDAEAGEIVSAVRRFIEAHGKSRFERLGELKNSEYDETVINRAGYVAREDGERLYYIFDEAWKEVCAGLDSKSVVKVLDGAGYLANGDGRNLKRRPPTGAGVRPRLYCIRETILGNVATEADE